MKFLMLTAAVMSLGLASCGWSENPFHGKSQGVQQAEPPATNQKPQADDEKSLRIETEDFYSFTENQDAQYQIKGVVLLANADYDLSIENMEDFPDAKFDAASGTFDWTPPDGFITDYNTKRMNLNILMSTKNVTPIRIKHKTVPVFVTPAPKIPTVISVDWPRSRSFVREGEILKFDVKVKDITGFDADGNRPMIAFTPSNYSQGSIEAASLFTMQDLGFGKSNPEQDVKDPSLWTFHMQADLTKREVTTSSLRLYFNVVAISRFKVQSQPVSQTLDVYTNLQTPTLSWNQPVEMKAGQKNSFTFMVFDPRGEGDVQYSLITDCAKIHANLQCGTCKSVNDANFGRVLYCPVSWDIPADYLDKGGADQVTLQMQVGSKSKISGDNYSSASQVLTRTIKILKPDAVSNPTPSPAPTVGGN